MGSSSSRAWGLPKRAWASRTRTFWPPCSSPILRSWMDFGNVEAVEEDGGVGLGGVAVLVADDAFELAEAHAVGVGQFGLLVDAVALFEGGPERLVAHDDGVDDAIGVEGELVLAEHAELARADDGALLRVELAGEDLHEGGFAGAVGSGEAVAAAGDKGDADVLEEHLRAVAHGDIADTDHSFLVPNGGAAGMRPRGPDDAGC